MLRRKLPGTDLDLSVVGMGCWAIGGEWWGDDVRDDVSEAAIGRALDHGINWFDTAPLYGHGHADEVLVKALGSRKRDVVIASKVGVRWDNEGRHAHSDLTPAWIRADLEANLKRLGVETVDLLQIHWPCELGTPLQESIGALESLRKEGKFRYLGVCNYKAAGLRDAAQHGHIDSLQTPYSMLRREFEAELQPLVLDFPQGRQLGVLAYEPLCRGLLTGKYKATQKFPDSDLRSRDERWQGPRFLKALTLVSRLELIARRRGVPVAALALAWVLRQAGLTAVIAGAKTPQQIDEHVQAVGLLDQEALWPQVDGVVDSFRG